MPPDPIGLEVGTELGGYRIERAIARGGMGEVWAATQLSLDRPVALKVIAPELGSDDGFRQRFRREARIAASLDHPGVLPVYESGELPDGRLFLAMRLVDGEDLSAVVERGPMPVGDVVALLTQVAEALDVAHEAGLVHRDVKPANVLVEERRDGRRHAYLSDFGLAKVESSFAKDTATGNVVGTVDFMAPEQARGDSGLDGRVDVYAFGCMFYACLTGLVPYDRDTQMATMLAHVNDPPPKPSVVVPGLPAAVDKVVARAMAKDPERRARSAGALMRWLAEQLPEAASTPPSGRHVDTAATRVSGITAPPPPVTTFALNLLILAPLWIVAYLIGGSL